MHIQMDPGVEIANKLGLIMVTNDIAEAKRIMTDEAILDQIWGSYQYVIHLLNANIPAMWIIAKATNTHIKLKMLGE